MIDILIIVLAILFVLLGLWSYIRGFKKGQPNCGGRTCSSCPYGKNCRKDEGRGG